MMESFKQMLKAFRTQTPQAIVALLVLPFCWQQMAGKDWDLICVTVAMARDSGLAPALPYILGCAAATLVTLFTAVVIIYLKSKHPTASIA
jgi:hypothetical protein